MLGKEPKEPLTFRCRAVNCLKMNLVWIAKVTVSGRKANMRPVRGNYERLPPHRAAGGARPRTSGLPAGASPAAFWTADRSCNVKYAGATRNNIAMISPPSSYLGWRSTGAYEKQEVLDSSFSNYIRTGYLVAIMALSQIDMRCGTKIQ